MWRLCSARWRTFAFLRGSGARCSDGEWRTSPPSAEPRFSADGEFLGHVGISPDITERKRSEEALRDSEARLRGITDSARDGILMLDFHGDISHWNPAAESILGYRKDEAIGKNLHRLLVPERRHEVLPEWSRQRTEMRSAKPWN